MHVCGTAVMSLCMSLHFLFLYRIEAVPACSTTFLAGRSIACYTL